MPLQYREEGSREAVIKHLEQLVELAPDGKTPAKDQAQAQAARAFAIAEIKALPTEFNGVLVNLEGNAHAGGRTFNLNIVPKKLRL
jgi:uncharacterized protein Smg (DUF494 family)